MKQRRKNVQMFLEKNERTNILKEVKHLCKVFGFTASMLKSELVEGGEKK